MRLALGDEGFVRDHLPGAKIGRGPCLPGEARSLGGPAQILSRTEAREQVLAVARAGQQAGLGARLAPLVGVVALEFAAGACNGLDEYTLFLTPGHLSDAQASLRGRFAGIGIDVAVVEQRLEITRVYPRSPAAEAGLARHDRILRIDRQFVDTLTPNWPPTSCAATPARRWTSK